MNDEGMKSMHNSDRVKEFIKNNKGICIVVALLFLQRILVACSLGFTYNINSDDLSYVISGIEFANTGKITMHGVLSAQIMPGMPVLIGAFSLLFGEGKLLWVVLKICWFVMGSLCALYIYKSVTIFAPKWCGILASITLFAPDFVWMDNMILTETPFMFFFVIMIYETLMMGKHKESNHFWLCALAYMCAMMFKANIGVYPIFAMIYLLLVKYDFKLLLKQGLILGGIVLCFVIPWSVRNYIHYDAFVPLTWGAGNPMLLGTYQGIGYPSDEELDYETNVDQVAQEKYVRYYKDNGEVKEPYLEKYLALEKDMIKAKYRMEEWKKREPLKMAISYLVLKPKMMIDSVFYWEPITHWVKDGFELRFFRHLNLAIVLITMILSLLLKKNRAEIFFFLLLYFGNIYIYAMTFAFDRYAATLMPVRYMIAGIGIYLFSIIVKKIKHKKVPCVQ